MVAALPWLRGLGGTASCLCALVPLEEFIVWEAILHLELDDLGITGSARTGLPRLHIAVGSGVFKRGLGLLKVSDGLLRSCSTFDETLLRYPHLSGYILIR